MLKNSSLLLLEDKLGEISNESYISTDDGLKGYKGFTSQILEELFKQGRLFDLVMAAGPVPMMRAVSNETRPHKVRTVVRLNPIMVD